VKRKALLAIVSYTKTFRQYLLGRQFVIRTDHSALQWLRTTPEPIGQQARWCEILKEFNFQIVHRFGRIHGNADAISRRPCRQCGNDGENKVSVKIRAINFVTIEEGDRWSRKEIAEATEKDVELATFVKWLRDGLLPLASNDLARHDPATKSLHAQWERFKLTEGISYRKFWSDNQDGESWQLVSPVAYRKENMRTAHASMTGGHMGVKKTQVKVAKQAYWVRWSKDVRNFCRSCGVCAKYHCGATKKQSELQNMCVGPPWERVAIDITRPHPQSTKGNKFMITVLDHFTKYAFVFPVRSHDAIPVAKYLVERVFLVYGVPTQLLSDGGAEFKGSVMREVCRLMEIDKIRTTSYKPSTNDALERIHRTLNTMLGKILSEN